MKYNLREMTFLIPLRVDSLVRLENILMSIEYLLRHFDTNIFVLQADNYDSGIVSKFLNKRVKYRFMEDYDNVFYRTKYLNIMTTETSTPFIAIWDADVIVPYQQIIDSFQKLHEGFEIAYPYDGHFYDTSDIIREVFFKSRKLQILEQHQSKMGLTYGDKMIGGAIFVNRDAYVAAGMECEDFYGWGPEDWERFERWRAFNYKIYRAHGNLYHLTHSRGINSTHRSMEHFIDTNKRCRLNMLSNNEDLRNNINTIKKNG